MKITQARVLFSEVEEAEENQFEGVHKDFWTKKGNISKIHKEILNLKVFVKPLFEALKGLEQYFESFFEEMNKLKDSLL